MTRTVTLTLMLSALFLGGCRTTWPEGATIMSPSGERLCAKHRVPLVRIRSYQAPRYPVVLVHEASRPYYGVVGQYYPNHIPEHVSLRPGWILTEPTTIAYCPLCEKQFLEELRVPDEKAAIEFAKDALPIWGGGGVATKGPYEVSLHNGIWRVSCFLVDGRRATIKIGKETGRVLDTQYRK
jgi:hypothetical protein